MFVSKIETLEPRAYLKIKIGKERLGATETQTNAREFVDQAITEVRKEPKTIPALRLLFTAANFYLKIDLNRSISVLTTAIETTNQVNGPDFQSGADANNEGN